MLCSASRHLRMTLPALDIEPPGPTRRGDAVWLEPYPEVLLPDLPDTAAGPEGLYETQEAISLALDGLLGSAQSDPRRRGGVAAAALAARTAVVSAVMS
jgi:hypothetical protein